MFEKQRKITVLALILGLPMLLSGQERPARFYYGIGGGISNPVLGYQDYHSPALGLAQPGFMASWNLGYQMPSGIGFGLNSCYLLNKINSTTMAEKIREENKTTSSVEVSASNYQHWGVTANVSYSHKLTKKWSLMASSGLGILWSTTPEITLDIENAPPQHIEIKSATASAGLWHSELSVGYAIGTMQHIDLFVSYIQSKPSFTFTRNEVVMSIDHKIAATTFGLKYYYSISKR